MIPVQPIGDRVLVQSIIESRTRDSGIIMPGDAITDVHKKGRVVKVGTGKVSKKGVQIPIDLEEGDVVVYSRFLENTHSGEALRNSLPDNHFIIETKDILYVVEEGENSH